MGFRLGDALSAFTTENLESPPSVTWNIDPHPICVCVYLGLTACGCAGNDGNEEGLWGKAGVLHC